MNKRTRTFYRRIGRKGGLEARNQREAWTLSALVRARRALRLTLNGHSFTVKEWSEKLNIPVRTIWRRKANGLSDVAALQKTKNHQTP